MGVVRIEVEESWAAKCVNGFLKARAVSDSSSSSRIIYII